MAKNLFLNKISEILSHQGVKKYFKNISWRLADKAVRFCTCFVASIFVVRYLGPEKLGKLNYALGLGGIFVAVSYLGIGNHVLIKEIAQTDNVYKLFGSILKLRIFSVGAMLLLSVLVMWALSIEYQMAIYIFFLSSTAVFSTIGLFPESVYTVHAKAEYLFWPWTVNNIIIAALRFFLIYIQAPFSYFVLSTFLDMSLPYLLLWMFYKKFFELKFKLWTYDGFVVKKLLKQTWPLIVMSFMSVLFHKIDIILIRHFWGDLHVGNFSLATTICEYSYTVPTIVSAALFPAVVNAKKRGEVIYHKRLKMYYSFMIYIGVSIALIFTLFGKIFVIHIYGKDFTEAASILRILTWEIVFNCLGVAFGNYIILEGWIQKFIYRSIASTILNISLNIILLPKMGILGAAVSTVVTQIFVNYLYDLLDPQLRKQFVLKTKSFNLFSYLNIQH